MLPPFCKKPAAGYGSSCAHTSMTGYDQRFTSLFPSCSYCALCGTRAREPGKRLASGAVPVKIRLAIALRMLAGASYLDVAVFFGVAKETVFHILWQVIDAINNTPEVGSFYFPQTVDTCARQAKEWEVRIFPYWCEERFVHAGSPFLSRAGFTSCERGLH